MRAAVCLLPLLGCIWVHEPVPVARVAHGPAYASTPHVIAALPVECVACQPGELAAIMTLTRMALELDGYTIFDAELVNAEARRRNTIIHENLREGPPPGPPLEPALGGSREDQTTVEATPGWAEASDPQRREILDALGVDGTLRTGINRHATNQGTYGQVVTIRISVARLDGTPAWSAECAVDTDGLAVTSTLLERAARCAVASEELW